jgi:hypothetical protein
MLFFNIIHVGQTALKSISTHYVRANTSKLESIVGRMKILLANRLKTASQKDQHFLFIDLYWPSNHENSRRLEPTCFHHA